jgi:hypothetical protein
MCAVGDNNCTCALSAKLTYSGAMPGGTMPGRRAWNPAKAAPFGVSAALPVSNVRFVQSARQRLGALKRALAERLWPTEADPAA